MAGTPRKRLLPLLITIAVTVLVGVIVYSLVTGQRLL